MKKPTNGAAGAQAISDEGKAWFGIAPHPNVVQIYGIVAPDMVAEQEAYSQAAP